MDLFKAHNCLLDDHLIAKLQGCGLDNYCFLLPSHYLDFHNQRTKIDSNPLVIEGPAKIWLFICVRLLRM